MALDPEGGAAQPTKKRKPQRRSAPPPPPPPTAARPRSVERPGSSSVVRNPNSIKSYPFIRVSSGVNWQGVAPSLLQKLNLLGRRTNNVITLTSGFRTHAEQRRLYAAHLRGEIGLAAPPGQSNHEHGGAVDAVIDGQAIGHVVDEGTLNSMGLRSLTHLGDAVHVELSDGGGGGAPASSPAPSSPGMAPAPSVSAPAAEYAAPSYAPAPTGDEFTGVTDTAELLPFELDQEEEPPVARMNAQQRAQTWQLIAGQPGASPEAQTLARIAQISTGG